VARSAGKIGENPKVLVRWTMFLILTMLVSAAEVAVGTSAEAGADVVDADVVAVLVAAGLICLEEYFRPAWRRPWRAYLPET